MNSYIYSSIKNDADFVTRFNKDFNFEGISIDANSELSPYKDEKVYSYNELPVNAKCEFFFNGSKENTQYLFNDPRNVYYGYDSSALVLYDYTDNSASEANRELRTINTVEALNNCEYLLYPVAYNLSSFEI